MDKITHEVDISKSNAPLHIKFALVCLNKTAFPKWLGLLCFILSHFQFVALIIKSVYLALDDNTPSSSPAIRFFVKLFVVGDWLSPIDAAPIFTGTVIITIYTVKMLSLMVYIHFALFMKRRVPDLTQKYWGLIHSFHPLVMFFWIHTFCMEIILHPPQIEGAEGIRAIAFINTVVNCLLAVFFSMISVTYKTVDVLSSKTSMLETKTVILKIIIPTLWEVAETSQGVQIFVLILSLGKTVLHDWIFIKYLPYYRINVLVFSMVLQAAQTSLALAGCIVKFVEAGGAHIGIFTFQMVSLLLVPLTIKAYHSETWRIILYIFGCEVKSERNVYYLVHKRFILLYFLKSRQKIHKGISKYSFADIMYQAKLIEMTAEFPLEELDQNKKLLERSLKRICIEILSLYPKALLAQINLAYSYSNFEDLYLVSNNLLEDAISKRPGYHAQISLNMIRFELQKKFKLLFSQKTGEGGLNIDSFVINHELHERLKNSIRKQAEMQINFWTEFMSNGTPRMMTLMNIALGVENQKKIIKRLWNSLSKIRPNSFLSPLTVYGMYSSLVNNNPIEGEEYIEQSQDDSKRISRLLKADELNNQTIFSEQSVQITMSGLKSKLGKIMDCSTNIANFYGWQRAEMKDRPVISLMPPFFRHRHDGFLLNHFNTGKTKIMNTTILSPVKRANGYIHPSWIHIKVSPLMDHGMSYVSLLRPCKSSQRMVLVRENGTIDDMSFEFAKDMNLLKKEDQHDTDILRLCPEFREINEAFNLIARNSINHAETESNTKEFRSDYEINTQRNLLSTQRSEFLVENAKITERPLLSGYQKRTKIDTETAQSIYEKFTKGSTLIFSPSAATMTGKTTVYEVKISNSIHGNDVIKIVLLEKISHDETDHQDENVMSPFPISDMKQKDEIISAPKFDAEGEELIYLNTLPREKRELPLLDPINDITDILDEVQNDDSVRISKNIINVRNLTSSSPRKKKQGEIQVAKPPSAGKLLNQKRKRIPKEEVENVAQIAEIAQFGSSISSSYVSKGKKAEQLAIKALKSEPKKKSASIFTYQFIAFLISMTILLVAQNTNLRVGIRDVESQIPVISSGFFRQFNMIYTALEVVQWKGALEGKVMVVDWETDNLILGDYLGEYLVGMKARNSQFYELLNQLPFEIQSEFYKDNVGIYEFDENGNKTLIGMFTTFEAFQMMIEKEDACMHMDLPAQFEDGIDTSNHKFILDNILNDLLIESESQIVRLTDELNKSTNSTTWKMGLTMGISLAVCFAFVIISVRYLWVIASEGRIFMTVIFQIKLAECEVTIEALKHFIGTLGVDMKNEKVRVQHKTKEEEENSHATRFRRASMHSFYRSLRIAFLKLLPIYSLFICWSIVHFFSASNFMQDIRDAEKRMQASLQALNNQGVLVYGLAGISLTNGTGIVKNKPIVDVFEDYLENLQKVDHFVDTFRDQNGKLTALQQKVLFNYPCKDLLTLKFPGSYQDAVLDYESCLALGKGAVSTSLVEVNAGLYTAASYALQLFENSNKTQEELTDIFLTSLGMGRDYVNVAEGFFKILYEATYAHFEEDVDSIQRKTLDFTIFIVIGTGVATFITWHYVMKKIFRAQKIDWFILQIVPVKLILGNKHIQQYLLKHSDGMFDGVRGFL